jgi:hypothetical protein
MKELQNQLKNETFWLHSPSVLFDMLHIKNIWPINGTSMETKLNAITRIIMLLTFIGLFIVKTEPYRLIVTTLVTLGIIIVYQRYYSVVGCKQDTVLGQREGFTNSELYEQTRSEYTTPSKENPFMNVSHTDIQENPNRKTAGPSYNPVVKQEIDNAIKSNIALNSQNNSSELSSSVDDVIKKDALDRKLFQDMGDEIDFELSNRQFYTMPNTTVPNNQDEFIKFCYKNLAVDKDNSRNTSCAKA